MIKLCGCKQAKSIPGLTHETGLCQKHYNMLMYGTDEERKQAIPYMYAVYMTAEEWKQYKLLNKIEE